MKIALITDTHFGARNDNLVFNEYFYDFWDGVFFPYLKEHNIKHAIHLGDIMDRRKFGNYNTIHYFRNNFLNVFQEEGIELDIIVGNHDTYFKRTNEVNSIGQLVADSYPLIRVHPEPSIQVFDGRKILFLPWINTENAVRSHKLIESKEANVIMGHLELSGFEMYSGHESDKGEDKNRYSDYEMVMTGHYHHRSTKGNIYYLGSTYEITWHDYGDERGFHIFDTETLELEYIRNPLHMFHKVYYDDSDIEDGYEHLLFEKYDFDQYRNRYVKVIAEKKNNSTLFQRFVDKLHDANPYDLSIVDSFEMGSVGSSQVGMVEDTLSLLYDYIKSMSDINEKEKNRLISLMRTLNAEALEME